MGDGAATLAEMIRDEAREEAWAEALEVTRGCIAAYPQSHGAQGLLGTCSANSRVASSARWQHGAAPPRRLGPLTHRLVPGRAKRGRRSRSRPATWRGSIFAPTRSTSPAGWRPDARPGPTIRKRASSAKPTPGQSWSVAARSDPEAATRPAPRIDLPLGNGGWMILVSVREDFAEKDNTLRLVPMVLGDLALLGRGGSDETGVLGGCAEPAAHRVRACRSRSIGTTIAAVAGAEWRAGQRTRRRLRAAGEPTSSRSHAVLARDGSDLALLDSFSFPGTEPHRGGRAPDADLHRSRDLSPRTRPCTVKALVYHGLDGALEPARGVATAISLVDPNGETVARVDAATNAFGTASGELAIPPGGRLLGAWSLQSSHRGPGARSESRSTSARRSRSSCATPKAPCNSTSRRVSRSRPATTSACR